MTRALDWNVQGRDWPNREASRFIEVRGLRWHVQVMGVGPRCVRASFSQSAKMIRAFL